MPIHAGVLRSDQRDAPAQGAGDDQAFGAAEQNAAEQQYAKRYGRRRHEGQRCEIGQAGDRRYHQAYDHGALRATDIGEAAGPGPRQQCRGELGADHNADDHRAQAQRVMQMQRQHRQRQPDGEKADKHGERDRQHLEEDIVFRRRRRRRGCRRRRK
jgi:hypothetical protein